MNSYDTFGTQVTCALASNRHCHWVLADRLIARTGCDFVLISDPEELTAAKLASINPKFVFSPHWSHRIDSSIYEQFECVTFHMTDLPYGREIVHCRTSAPAASTRPRFSLFDSMDSELDSMQSIAA
jgi:hypothetical protein